MGKGSRPKKHPMSAGRREPNGRAQRAPKGPDTLTEPTDISESQWRSFVGYYHRRGEWCGPGPRPDREGCLAPQSVLAEFGYAQRMGDAA